MWEWWTHYSCEESVLGPIGGGGCVGLGLEGEMDGWLRRGDHFAHGICLDIMIVYTFQKYCFSFYSLPTFQTDRLAIKTWNKGEKPKREREREILRLAARSYKIRQCPHENYNEQRWTFMAHLSILNVTVISLRFRYRYITTIPRKILVQRVLNIQPVLLPSADSSSFRPSQVLYKKKQTEERKMRLTQKYFKIFLIAIFVYGAEFRRDLIFYIIILD